MKACIHLDYDGEYSDCEIKDCSPDYPDVKYWYRNNPPYKGAPAKVQFCKKFGRIDGIFECYKGEMSCYECVKK